MSYRSGSLIVEMKLGTYESQDSAEITTALHNLMSLQSILIMNQTVTVTSLKLNGTTCKLKQLDSIF